MRRLTILLLAFALVLGVARRAQADCTEGSGGCPDFAGTITGLVLGGLFEGTILVGGIVSMAGGANDLVHHRTQRKWRVANYVFGALNLAAGTVFAGFAAAGTLTTILGPVGLLHLGLGSADLGIGVVSQRRADGSQFTGVNLSWRF